MWNIREAARQTNRGEIGLNGNPSADFRCHLLDARARANGIHKLIELNQSAINSWAAMRSREFTRAQIEFGKRN